MSYSRGEKIEWRHWIPIVGTKQKKKTIKAVLTLERKKNQIETIRLPSLVNMQRY